MSKKNYTHIGVVIDRSGSMSSMKNDVIGGFNNFVSEQKKIEGEATMTLAQFDTEYDLLQDFKALGEVPDLTSAVFQPRGSTALLDAMGKTLTDVREKIKKMDEEDKPEKVIFVFITDGEENASGEYGRDRVFKMIEDLRNEEDINWEFVFIGANQDAIQAGGHLGVRASASLTIDASGSGATMAFQSLSNGMTSYRRCATKSASYAFSDQDRDVQKDLMDKIDSFDKSIPSNISDASVLSVGNYRNIKKSSKTTKATKATKAKK